MSLQAKILCFAGSARRESFNQKLVKIAMRGAEESGEIESGLPENAVQLKALFLNHNGLLMACPEYNSSVSPLWKNVIDWVSRPAEGETPLKCFSGKTAAIISASPGQLGGLRGLTHVRSILENIQVMVIPDQIAVSQASAAFSADATKLVDEKKDAAVRQIGAKLAQVCLKLLH